MVRPVSTSPALDPWEHVARTFEPARPSRWPTPGALARHLNPRTIQTPALDLIDQALINLADTPDGRLIITMAPQEGKALALDTPVPTPTGWTTMGALRAGDQVIGGNGQPCTVAWVSPIWTGRDCYRVTTGDGEDIVADGAHEWVAKVDRRRSTRIVETVELAKSRNKAAQITAPTGGLDLPAADLPLDPYVLGVWLGDGTTGQAGITCHPDDVAIRDRFAAAGWPLRHTGKMHWTMAPEAPNGTWGRGNPTPAKAALRAAGVLTDKHIPTAYLRASRAQRLALLQGLIDSDGYVMPKGQVEFCSVKRRLAEDVRELVYSLGGKAVVGTGRATIAGRDFGPKYRVRFYLANAAHLPRKAERCRDSSVGQVRYVRAVPVESVPTVCIEVNSPDHMFLVGRTMLPTHNSVRVAGDFPVWWLTRDPDARIIAASYGQGLANRNGRSIRNRIAANPGLGLRVAPDNGAAGEWQIDGHDGGVYSVGIGAGVTGRACDLLLIDDPIKSRAEADSEIYRNRVWDWWTDEASARLAPGAPVALILCMTGDTPVLLASGIEKPLRDIQPGEAVATYEAGKLRSSYVVNHASQGYDSVYRITTKSGASVRANGRHPFLVIENGTEKWRQTDQIKPGAFILRATGDSIAASNAQRMDANNRRSARASVVRTMARLVGRLGIAHHRPSPDPGRAGRPNSSIATGSRWISTSNCWPIRTMRALSALSLFRKSSIRAIGPKSYALTTATTPEQCEDCSATTATSSLLAGTPPESFAALLNTWSVSPDEVISVEPVGEAEVFDVQIAGTENFIADGLVSHNTRWHHDDLAGRLIAEGGWTVLNLPAQCEDPATDPLGRAEGEFMVSTRGRTRAQWELRKRTAGTRTWASLYQGRPTPDTGNLFPSDGWARYDRPLWLVRDDGARIVPDAMRDPDVEIIQSWDLAFKDTESSDYVVGQVWMRRGTQAFLLDQIRRRMGFTESCQAMLDMTARWPQAIAKLVEDKANGPAVMNALRAKVGGLIPVEPEGSKYARAVAITPLVEAHDVVLPDPVAVEGTAWVTDLTEEARDFPGASHDDTVDGMSQAVHRLLLVPMLAGQTLYPEDVLGDGVELDWVADLDY